MRKAVVRNIDGFVENIIEWEPESKWPIPEGCSLIDAENGSPGDTWDGEKFVRPVLPEPEPERDPLVEIDKINAKLADYDELKAKVEALEKA